MSVFGSIIQAGNTLCQKEAWFWPPFLFLPTSLLFHILLAGFKDLKRIFKLWNVLLLLLMFSYFNTAEGYLFFLNLKKHHSGQQTYTCIQWREKNNWLLLNVLHISPIWSWYKAQGFYLTLSCSLYTEALLTWPLWYINVDKHAVWQTRSWYRVFQT